jgi:hypothetical protein
MNEWIKNKSTNIRLRWRGQFTYHNKHVTVSVHLWWQDKECPHSDSCARITDFVWTGVHCFTRKRCWGSSPQSRFTTAGLAHGFQSTLCSQMRLSPWHPVVIICLSAQHLLRKRDAVSRNYGKFSILQTKALLCFPLIVGFTSRCFLPLNSPVNMSVLPLIVWSICRYFPLNSLVDMTVLPLHTLVDISALPLNSLVDISALPLNSLVDMSVLPP